jgi:glycosyltransferase involved in cell wall biosynthesis
MSGNADKVLLLVENLSVPFDRRVWREALALRDAGLEVTVICPQGEHRDTEPAEVIDGVRIRRFRLPQSDGSPLGFVREFATAVWRSLRLAWRERPFKAIHVANPPDVLFLVALPFRLFGTRLVYDQHDLAPELYESRFGRRDLFYWLLRLTELASYRLASLVISTNESYRRIALGRGRKAPGRVAVVRNGPELSSFTEVPQNESLKRGKPHLLCYLGVMGPQDGVDLAVRALDHLRTVRKADDWHAVFIGDGDSLESLRSLTADLGLGDRITFTGFLDEEVRVYLSTADLGLVPDPKSSLNDASTLVKVMEYMALGCPVVSFDLAETRFSAQDAAVYATGDDPERFARAIDELLDDPARRAEMADRGRRRVEQELAWERSRVELAGAYRDVLGLGAGLPAWRPAGEPTVEPEAVIAR